MNPTARKQSLRALDMRATVDREEFFQFQRGDARLKLIERLAAAYRAGELPDYMLQFVDSLRTASEVGLFLSPLFLSPKPDPKIRGPRQRDPECRLFQRLSVLQAMANTLSLSLAGRCPSVRTPPRFAGTFKCRRLVWRR